MRAFSIRSRLALSYGIVMAAALIAFSAGGLWLQARWGRAQFDSELASLGAAVSRVMQEELDESGNLPKAVAETRTSTNVPGRATAILDTNGTPLGAHWNGFLYSESIWTANARMDTTAPHFATLNESGSEWRVLLRPESSAAGNYVILVAGPLDQLTAQQRLLFRVLLIATPLIVLLTTGLCWWVASTALRPVTLMATQAAAITARSAAQRLDTPVSADEVGQLAQAFNQLLGRLGTALRMQRQFMADASHELRTPVSVIQTAAEVTLEREDRTDVEYREALTIVTEQSARLTRVVGDMLILARADAGGYRLTARPLYLDEIVDECARAASVLAATKGVQFLTNIRPEVPFVGDDALLGQMVTNLLDNAVHYTRPGDAVTVSLEVGSARATITVSDTGAGIPAADRDRIFDRFVRLDPARASTSGAGLGLPIARWIAEQHGGMLTVDENAAGGCSFVVWLPT
jgi:two-component system OmpR family sensor kinase